MSTIAQYDLLDMIRQKCDIIGDDKSIAIHPITKINAFILFRAMWYCDEIHDFCSSRSGYTLAEQDNFAKIRFNTMKEDNVWYLREIFKSTGSYDGDDIKIIGNILSRTDITDAQKYVLRLYFSLDKNNTSLLPPENQGEIYFLREINDLKNYNTLEIKKNYDIIPDLRTPKNKLNQIKAKTPYITSNNLAHSLTSTIRQLFFGISNISFSDLLDCKYEFDFYKASIVSSNFLSLFIDKNYSQKTENAKLYLNIDPTGSGATLSPLHYTLWKYTQQSGCPDNIYKYNKDILKNLNEINDKLKNLNEINDKLIFSESIEQPNLNLLVTQANKWDASNDDELTTIAKYNAKIPITESPVSNFENIIFRITFGSADFLEYYYFKNGDKIGLQVTGFCGKPTGLEPINEKNGSVSNLASIIKTKNNYNYTVYKTCGDFLQFFTIAIYERSAYNDNDKIYSMLSQDLTGIDIGSLFCLNMIGCIHSGNKLKGLQMLLPENTVNEINRQKIDDPKWFNFLLNISSPDNLKLKKFKRDMMDPGYYNFGKYKHHKKNKKINSIKKEAKNLGISYKNKSKEKLEKHVNKVIQIAKKYRIKLNKETVKNIKNAIKIHNIAKKHKIKLTKMDKNNNRVYKTPKQLLKEIDKINITKKNNNRKR